MAVFPMFVDLKDKKCVVAGSGEVASRKVEILLRFEPDLTVVAPQISSSIIAYGNKGKLSIMEKEYDETDIEDAFLVIAATSSKEINEKVYQDAKKRNIPVNVVDDPEKCTFIFPSVVNRGDLSIGISTSGTYPALSKKIRKITEEIFTEEYTVILKMLTDFRMKVRNSNLNPQQREKLLKRVVDEFYATDEVSQEVLKCIIEGYEKEFLNRKGVPTNEKSYQGRNTPERPSHSSKQNNHKSAEQ